MGTTLLLGWSGLASAAAPDSNARDAWFEKSVRPIFAKHCVTCHGPEKQKSALRLDSGQGIFTGGSRGPAVEPGQNESLLLQAIRQTGELKMPPNAKLSLAEIDVLERWVMEGALWPDYDPTVPVEETDFRAMRDRHWAYQPLNEAAVPPGTSPAAAIDGFINQSLEREGLEGAPRADRRTLIRRLSYDLTGLPPTPEAVDAFVANERPDAYPALVDHLLASPHYGERWARHWLDVVRYTDSFDSRASDQTDPVEIWRYRDWVVAALNDDMPYDKFAALQIAGDVMPLPDGTFNRDGLIATGMLAIGHWPQGDADKEKMVTDIVDDQVDVVTRTFLGATMACARCHDHKFDPITTEDYYGLAGMFFSSTILPGPGAKTEGSPLAHWPLESDEDQARRKAAEARLAQLRETQATQLAEARAAFARREMARTDRYLLAAAGNTTAPPDSDLHPDVLRNWQRALRGDLTPALQRVAVDFQQLPGLVLRDDTVSTPSAVANKRPDEVRYSTITQAGNSLAIHPGPAEDVGIGWAAPVATNVTVSGRLADADGNCGDGIRWSVTYRESAVEHVIASGGYPNGGESTFEVEAPVTVTAGGQIRLTVMRGAEYACDTTQLNLHIVADDGQVWDLTDDVVPHFDQGNPWPDRVGHPDVWWIFRETGQSALSPILFAPWESALRDRNAGRRESEVFVEAAAMVQAAVNHAMADDASPLHPAVAQLAEANGPFWIEAAAVTDPVVYAQMTDEIADLEALLQVPVDLVVGIHEGGVPTTEYDGIQDVRVHRRGEYTNLGDLVPRRMPALMVGTDQRPVTEGSGRRELAQWLSGDCAPLLARVMVNRVWQHHFGNGLVRTPGDFGFQGQPPTHPELLDYLAAQFIESGWSLKALHRSILTTDAYQRRSGAEEELHNADPENRWLARMNRFRLDAESLRDSLFFVTDQLDVTPGGPAYVDLATPRRTLYLRTVRSNLSTYTQLFDGADPTSIVPARNESTVSPQALFLMNHPLMINTAEALATMASSDPTASAIDVMYRRLFLREATDAERIIGEEVLQDLGHPENTKALTAYAQVLLSSNEFYFID